MTIIICGISTFCHHWSCGKIIYVSGKMVEALSLHSVGYAGMWIFILIRYGEEKFTFLGYISIAGFVDAQ